MSLLLSCSYSHIMFSECPYCYIRSMHFLYQTMKVMQNFLGEFFWFWGIALHDVLSEPCSHVPSTQCSQNQHPSFFNFHPVTPDSYRKEINIYLRDIGINGKKKVKFDPSYQGRLWVLTLWSGILTTAKVSSEMAGTCGPWFSSTKVTLELTNECYC